MLPEVEQIARDLKAARKSKGLSQRELSKLTTVPQSHISKIESSGVDLRISSLIEIARALDLEVELVDRKQLAAVRTMTKSSLLKDRNNPETSKEFAKELQRLEKTTEELLREYPAVRQLSQLKRRVNDIAKLKVQDSSISAIKKVSNTLAGFVKNSNNLEAVEESLRQIKQLRNGLAHSQNAPPEQAKIRPVYSLDGDEHT